MRKRIHIYIIYLALFSFVVTGVSLSRYSRSIAGSDQVRAARAVIEYNPVNMTLNGVPMGAPGDGFSLSDMGPGDELSYRFNVTNFNGEYSNQTLMKYSIAVIFDPDPPAIPVEYEVRPDDLYPSAGTNWTYIGFESEETHSYTLTVTWEKNEIDPKYLDRQQSIQIQIHAEQVDSVS